MGAKQYLHTMKLLQLLMVNGDESLVLKAFHLHSIVDNIAQAIKGFSLGEFLFSLPYCGSDSETESTSIIYFYVEFDIHNFCKDSVNKWNGKGKEKISFPLPFQLMIILFVF